MSPEPTLVVSDPDHGKKTEGEDYLTELLCQSDSYMREFHAAVVETTPKGVVLDRTAFFTGGGGQPSDTGFLRTDDNREFKIDRFSRSGENFVHEFDVVEHLDAGTRVHGVIDWDRRYRLMRTHTALHILCGVVWRDYGALVTGGDMKPLSARMDFELESMSAEFAKEVEARINAEVAAERPVQIEMLEREEAFAIPDLIRTKINLLPKAIKEIRIVNIDGLDLQADGGTHVRNTREVGHIKVTGHESKGRINKRLRIEVEGIG